MRLLHPLAGSNLRTLLDAYRRYPAGPGGGRYRVVRLATLLAVLARFPFYQVQRLRLAGRIAAQPDPADPIFIVGHWRSGTTHLHNLLSQDPRFGVVSFLHTALPWDFLSGLKIGTRILEATLPADRGMDGVKLSVDSPQEEEMALGNMNPLCYYYTYYFPRSLREAFARSVLFEGATDAEVGALGETYRYLLRKLAVANGGRPLLLKNPPSTARVAWLKGHFPGARFVHIVRNPFVVFASTLKHFDRVMPEFALQDYAGVDFEEVTLENYRLLFDAYFAQRGEIPAGDIHELRFEDLEADPEREIERIYEKFELPGRADAPARIRDYLDGLGNYRKNRYRLTRAQVEAVRQRWAPSLEHWGYDLPPEVEVVG